MKYSITFLLAFTLVGLLHAQQTKVGTVNSDLIIGQMPQMKSVLRRVDNFAKQLDSTFTVKTEDYKKKVEAFKAEEKIMTDADKKARVQELAGLEVEMNKFRKNGSAMMQLRRDEYMRPIYKKVSEVIAEVAKANGYTQILTTQGNEFAYVDKRFDITQLVMDKLGIKLETK